MTETVPSGAPHQREVVDSRGTSRTLVHVSALNGLRGIAVLLVVGSHATIAFRPALIDTVLPGGFLGVDIFFVLSGFLITSLLLNEQSKTPSGHVSFRGFYRRRALRLLPALFALLAAHLIYTLVTGLPIGLEIESIFAALFYVSNWVMVRGHDLSGGLQHLWTLSVEEQFYLVWPILIVALVGIRRSLRFTLWVLCAAIVAVAVWRAMLWKDGTDVF